MVNVDEPVNASEARNDDSNLLPGILQGPTPDTEQPAVFDEPEVETPNEVTAMANEERTKSPEAPVKPRIPSLRTIPATPEEDLSEAQERKRKRTSPPVVLDMDVVEAEGGEVPVTHATEDAASIPAIVIEGPLNNEPNDPSAPEKRTEENEEGGVP